MAAGARCSPPKGQSVKSHTRSKPRSLKRAAAKRTAKLPWAVRDSRTGNVVSRHKTMTAAARERTRRDRMSFRAGRGRPFQVGKV